MKVSEPWMECRRCGRVWQWKPKITVTVRCPDCGARDYDILPRCLICGAPCPLGRVTCSDDCHEKFVHECEQLYGFYKKVIDAATGKAHRVPTRDIIENGLKYPDLKNYPEWEE
ncbi:MAG: DUF2116 family Zn-ribbon domain-containing protein [Candidatus Bathyarchaeia archaeon]